jgi:hypothetical protein
VPSAALQMELASASVHVLIYRYTYICASLTKDQSMLFVNNLLIRFSTEKISCWRQRRRKASDEFHQYRKIYSAPI